MKKTNKLLSISIIAILLSSCVVKNSGKYHAKQVKNTQISTLELRADMKIDETKKITGNATATHFLFWKISGNNHYADFSFPYFSNPFSKSALVKRAAQYEALSQSNADFIAKPSYTVKHARYLFGLMSKVDVSISGYGGVYKNFREYDPTDENVEILTNKKLVEQLNLNRGN